MKLECLNLELCSKCNEYPHIKYYGRKKKSLILICKTCNKSTKPLGPIPKCNKKLINFLKKIYQQWNDTIRVEKNLLEISVIFNKISDY